MRPFLVSTNSAVAAMIKIDEDVNFLSVMREDTPSIAPSSFLKNASNVRASSAEKHGTNKML
jgi:hypothetical protein